MTIEFEWDPAKAEANLKKHRVSFELAARVFADPLALVEQDRFENGEYLWQTLGMVDDCLLLLVAHTVTDDAAGDIIRIISARRAVPRERRRYEQESSL